MFFGKLAALNDFFRSLISHETRAMRFDPAEIEIRSLRESDLETIIGLTELLEEAPHWARESYAALVRPESWGERIALVAQERVSGEVLGFTVARLIAPEAELETIAVTQSRQRRGVGRQLLSALVLRLRQASVEALHLEVRASNRAAIGLYNTFGFSETGRRSRYYSGPAEDAVLMTLHLG